MDLCILSGIPPGVQSGVGDFSFLLAEELHKTHRVSLIVPDGPEIQAGFSTYRFRNEWTGDAPKEVYALINKLKPQIILFQYVPQLYGWKGANPALAILLRKLKKKGFHLITVAHEFSVPFEWPLTTLTLASAHRILFRAIVGASHQVIATTNFCLDLFQKSFPRHKSIFHYIPISSTVRRFPEEDRLKTSIRSKLGINAKELLIATFGFPIGDAVPLFQAVLSRILQTHPDSRFLFLGEPSHRLKSMFQKDSALESQIIATGTLSEKQVSNYLTASDLYVISYPDGASTRRTTLMAGLSHGVPTISNLGVLTDASLASSGAALLLKDSSEKELNALDEVLRNPNARKSLGMSGRNYYEKNLSILKAAEKYSELFRSLDGNEQVHP